MLVNIIDIFLCFSTVIAELIGTFLFIIFIQFSVYQLTGISLYNKIVNNKKLWN